MYVSTITNITPSKVPTVTLHSPLDILQLQVDSLLDKIQDAVNWTQHTFTWRHYQCIK